MFAWSRLAAAEEAKRAQRQTEQAGLPQEMCRKVVSLTGQTCGQQKALCLYDPGAAFLNLVSFCAPHCVQALEKLTHMYRAIARRVFCTIQNQQDDQVVLHRGATTLHMGYRQKGIEPFTQLYTCADGESVVACHEGSDFHLETDLSEGSRIRVFFQHMCDGAHQKQQTFEIYFGFRIQDDQWPDGFREIVQQWRATRASAQQFDTNIHSQDDLPLMVDGAHWHVRWVPSGLEVYKLFELSPQRAQFVDTSV